MELKSGTLLQGGKYKIEKSLGQGSFGITYLATAKFSMDSGLGKMDVVAKVAIKEFFMNEINGRKEDGSTVEGSTGSIFTNYKKRFRKEAENLAKLLHPNIVKVFDVFDENNTTYYVMEYLSDTNLNKYIKKKNGLSERECIELTGEIGGALQYMHDALMLHLDLKPGNIMLRNNEAVLIDFGLSKQFNANGQPESSTSIGQGTPGYASLEQQNYNGSLLNGLPYAMDVYALGGTMFKMITGMTPPDASSIYNDGFPRIELEKRNTSGPLIDIIERAMSPSKRARYHKVSDLLLALNQNFGIEQPERVPAMPELQASVIKSKAGTNDISDHTQFKSYENNCSIDNVIGPNAALKVGTEIKSPNGKKYTIDRLLGIGGFNFTYLCHPSDEPMSKVVIKEFFLSEYNCRKNSFVSAIGESNFVKIYLDNFKAISNILEDIAGHPNIEYFVESFDANGTYYIVSEYIEGVTLYDLQHRYNEKFSEKEVVRIAKEICTALGYMRTFGYLHLDIKPSNIILANSNRYILIDFGLARKQGSEESSKCNVGFTPGYASLEREAGTGKLTEAADVYSLGATMYTLLTGHTPLRAYDILQNGFSSMGNELKNNHVSLELIKVIKTAMSISIENRYQTAEALSRALSKVKQTPINVLTHTSSQKSNESEKLRINTEVDNVSDFKNQTNNETQDNNKQVSYKWPIAILSVLILLYFLFS